MRRATDGIWSHPDWRRYFAARCVSVFGSVLTWIALPVLAYSLTGSGAWVAAIAATQALPYLALGLVAGLVADRRDRKRLMVASDLVSAAALVTIPVAGAAGQLHPLHLLAVAAVVQACFVFFDAANFAAVPALVSADRLVMANSRVWTATSVIEVVTPAAAGVLIVLWPTWSLVAVDAGSFLVSAALLSATATRFSRDRSRAGDAPSASSQIRDGIRFILENRLILDTTLVNLLLCVANGALVGQVVVWADVQFGVASDDGLISVFFTAFPVGAVLGAAITNRVVRSADLIAVVARLCAFSGVVGIVALWMPRWWLALPLVAVYAAANLAAIIVGVSVRQRETPEPLMSRVNTTGRAAAYGLGFPAGAAFGGLAGALTTPALAVSLAFLAPIAAAVWVGSRARRSAVMA